MSEDMDFDTVAAVGGAEPEWNDQDEAISADPFTDIAIRVAGPAGVIPLVVRNALYPRDLVPLASAAIGAGIAPEREWLIKVNGTATPLDPDRTLAECGVQDTDTLCLVPEPLVTPMPKSWFLRVQDAWCTANATLPPPTEAWSKPSIPSLPQRFKDAWARSDYQSQLESALHLKKPAGCTTVVVVSIKGGVGKTSLTSAFSQLIRLAVRDGVVAADANPDGGRLPTSLNPGYEPRPYSIVDTKVPGGLRISHEGTHEHVLDLMEEFEGGELIGHIPVAGGVNSSLKVLGMSQDPEARKRLTQADYESVFHAIQKTSAWLLIDCGTSTETPAARAAITTADHVMVVLPPRDKVADQVRQGLRQLRAQGELRDQPITVVLNMRERGTEKTLSADGTLEVLAPEFPTITGLVEVPWYKQAVQRLVDGEQGFEQLPKSLRWALTRAMVHVASSNEQRAFVRQTARRIALDNERLERLGGGSPGATVEGVG